jgi:hypothetical protein
VTINATIRVKASNWPEIAGVDSVGQAIDSGDAHPL